MIIFETFLSNILKCFKNFKVFSGRASRSEYLSYSFFAIGIYKTYDLLLEKNSEYNYLRIYIDGLNGWSKIFTALLPLLIFIFIWIAHVSVSIRRLHDLNRKAIWVLIMFIPYLNILAGALLGYKKGDSEANQFGEPPK